MDRRAFFERKLTGTCDVHRTTSSQNAFHEVVGTESLVASGVPCFAAMPTGRKVVIPAGVDASKLRLFYFKHDAGIQERDRIVFLGRSYTVNYVDPVAVMPDGNPHHIEAMCETYVGG